MNIYFITAKKYEPKDYVAPPTTPSPAPPPSPSKSRKGDKKGSTPEPPPQVPVSHLEIELSFCCIQINNK